MLIRAEGLSIRQQGKLILDRIDLSIDPREIVTVVGPNGSGKSTLLRALLGALPPAAGRVTRADGLRIGYVPQTLQVVGVAGCSSGGG